MDAPLGIAAVAALVGDPARARRERRRRSTACAWRAPATTIWRAGSVCWWRMRCSAGGFSSRWPATLSRRPPARASSDDSVWTWRGPARSDGHSRGNASTGASAAPISPAPSVPHW